MTLRLSLLLVSLSATSAFGQELFEFQPHTSHWTSPETRDAPPGQGGRENQGAKGHPYETIRAGQSLVLANIQGSGIIRRIWITVETRTPVMLRSLRLEMFWDDAARPAVSAPLGDFFGAALGQTVAFENALFSSPEGRSFNTIVPMPFRRAARLVLTNESTTDLPRVFYDVDYTLGPPPADMLYFHAYLASRTSDDARDGLPGASGYHRTRTVSRHRRRRSDRRVVRRHMVGRG